jgi:glucose/arabinose dehydrogenase
MQKKSILVLTLLGLAVMFSAVSAQDAPRTAPPNGSQYRLVEVASGLRRPLLVTNAGDGSNRLFVVSQDGYIYILQDEQVLDSYFLDVSNLVSRDASERGLLGLAFHPDYETNGQFFINYTDNLGDTVIARYTVSADDPNKADPASAQEILYIGQPYANHNGGQLAFGPDGYLYIGTGDGGSAGDPQNNGQNPAVLLGKMLRIDVNTTTDGKPYGIPADNPFVDNPDFAPEVWAYGLRNPWRFSFDRETGDLYIADVGQNQWEEVNFQPTDSTGGENYGWRIMEGKHVYSNDTAPGELVAPFAEYDHNNGCSVTGGYVYRGEQLPDLQGVYLFSDYCFGTIWSSYRDEAGAWRTNVFMDTSHTVSSFGEDEAGELYVVNHNGTILQLVAA